MSRQVLTTKGSNGRVDYYEDAVDDVDEVDGVHVLDAVHGVHGVNDEGAHRSLSKKTLPDFQYKVMNAGVNVEKSPTGEITYARASAESLSIKHSAGDISAEAKGPSANARAISNNRLIGAQAGVELASVKASVGPVGVKAGLGCETGFKVGETIGVSVLGTGLSLGRETSISVFGSKLSLKFW